MHARGEMPKEVDATEVVSRYIKSIGKGILKVMSKMGISTYQSYCGAQIFDAVGLRLPSWSSISPARRRPSKASGWTRSPRRRRAATCRRLRQRSRAAHNLDVGGEYMFRMRGEAHMWSPDAVATLQHAVRQGSWETFQEFSRQIDSVTARAQTIRGMFEIKPAEETGRKPTAAGRGHAGGRHRQALLDRRDVVRLDLPRGAHDARRRHEPDRRQVEHRRGRRGAGSLFPAAGRQAEP
jgi:glutamate synthase (NADPH/NADH) large chain